MNQQLFCIYGTNSHCNAGICHISYPIENYQSYWKLPCHGWVEMVFKWLIRACGKADSSVGEFDLRCLEYQVLFAESVLSHHKSRSGFGLNFHQSIALNSALFVKIQHHQAHEMLDSFWYYIGHGMFLGSDCRWVNLAWLSKNASMLREFGHLPRKSVFACYPSLAMKCDSCPVSIWLISPKKYLLQAISAGLFSLTAPKTVPKSLIVFVDSIIEVPF